MDTDTCVFCKIVRGEIPSTKVYEDDTYIAFIDTHPRAPGHTLVIPKQHYRWIWDVPDFSAYWNLARKIALALQKAFGTDEIHVNVVGEEVPHAHIWLYPAPDKAGGDPKDFASNATKIKAALA